MKLNKYSLALIFGIWRADFLQRQIGTVESQPANLKYIRL